MAPADDWTVMNAAAAHGFGNEGMMSMYCGSSKLFVGGISATTTSEVLKGHFGKYGEIVDSVVMFKNGRPRGFGFVTFDVPICAALALVDAHWIEGRQVDVKAAVPGQRAQAQQVPQKERGCNKIFVGGLPQEVTTDDIKTYFGAYGPVVDSVVMVDRRTSRSRGFGFVRFATSQQGDAAAEAVMQDAGRHFFGGKWAEVKRATPAALLAQGSCQNSFDSIAMASTVASGLCGDFAGAGLCAHGQFQPLSPLSMPSMPEDTPSIADHFDLAGPARRAAALLTPAERWLAEGLSAEMQPGSSSSPQLGTPAPTTLETGDNIGDILRACASGAQRASSSPQQQQQLQTAQKQNRRPRRKAVGGSENDPNAANTINKQSSEPLSCLRGSPMKVACRNSEPPRPPAQRPDMDVTSSIARILKDTGAFNAEDGGLALEVGQFLI